MCSKLSPGNQKYCNLKQRSVHLITESSQKKICVHCISTCPVSELAGSHAIRSILITKSLATWVTLVTRVMPVTTRCVQCTTGSRPGLNPAQDIQPEEGGHADEGDPQPGRDEDEVDSRGRQPEAAVHGKGLRSFFY